MVVWDDRWWGKTAWGVWVMVLSRLDDTGLELGGGAEGVGVPLAPKSVVEEDLSVPDGLNDCATGSVSFRSGKQSSACQDAP